jgi:glutamine synthetase
MPKPLIGQNGSGMHVHQSLFSEGKNSFFNPDDKYFFSETAKQYIAGLLKYARELTLVTNQWVNSYKRLVPGYEAPIYISWATHNRSHLIRKPAFKKERGSVCRVEYRSPDPAANPYLAFAAMLSAGLCGINEKLKLPDALEINLFELDDKKRAELGISSLPGTLYEAIEATRGSKFMENTLGEHIYDNFIKNKELEWEEYRAIVTNYEIEKYLPIL